MPINFISLISIYFAGFFIVNLVIRDKNLREPIMNAIKEQFSSLASYKLQEDLNEIVACWNHNICNSNFCETLRNAAVAINKFFKKNNTSGDCTIDVDDFVESMDIINI